MDLPGLLARAKGNVDLAAELADLTTKKEEPAKPAKAEVQARRAAADATVAQSAYLEQQSEDVKAAFYRQRWAELIPHPSVGTIGGRRGHGKSGLGYELLELLSRSHSLNRYAIGLPSTKWHLIEQHVRPLPPEEVTSIPEDSVAFIDEAAMLLYARNWNGNEFSDLIQKIIDLSRQRRQTLIFGAHTMRKLDLSVVADIDWTALKMPSEFHARFERDKFRDITQDAQKRFSVVPPDRVKRTAFFYGDAAWGERMENGLPSFWSEELSQAFAGLTIEGKTSKPAKEGPRMKKLAV